MKLNWKKICAVALAAVMTAGYSMNVPVVNKVQAEENTPYITEIPGTDRTESKLDSSFFSVSGFAKGNVNDRSMYSEGDPEYAVVTNEMEFFDAISNAKYTGVKVIEIRADLKLGWNELSDEVKDYYGDDLIEPYEASETTKNPVGNPVLIESGVSTVTIDNIDGLTIFSTTGNSIKHAEIKFNSAVNDVVIRNLEFCEIWEWDDTREGSGFGSNGGDGTRKRTGWSNLKLNGCKNVWIDHCTFANSFDGNIDVENGSSGITISWCKIGDDDTSVGSVIYKTAMYLEELYQQNKQDSSVASFKIYKVMRDNGMTPEQIMQFMSQHDKAHLCGAGDKDSWLYDKQGILTGTEQFLDSPNYDKEDANEKIRLSLGYNSYSDIGQRLPMVRGGIGHLYNCYIDDSSLAEVIDILNSDPAGVGETIRSQISKKGLGCVTLARGIDARNGASVAADTCVYVAAQTAITGTAYHPNGSNINDGFQNTWKYNYALVVNSSFQKYGQTADEAYVGSSWDNNGKNPFIEDKSYWDVEKGDNKAAEDIIDNWKWRQEGVNAASGESLTELPYSYQTFPLEDVKENTDKYSGFRKLDLSVQDWLKVTYNAEDTISVVDSAVEIPIESIEMTKSEAILFMEEEFLQLEAQALPYHTTETESTYTWTSSNPEVAKVNECGLVIPLSIGTTRITVTTEKGLSTYCDVTVTSLPKKVEITDIPSKIYVGDIVDLDAIVSPENISDDRVVWQNNGANMELLDEEEGIFKAIKKGNNSVQTNTVLRGNRVGTNEGVFSIKTLQIVEPDVYTGGVELDKAASVNMGKTIQMNAKVLPENATNQKVVWKIADTSIATVDSNGLVTALKEGKTTVTVTTVNGAYEAVCELTVTKADIEDTTGGAVTPNPDDTTGGAVIPNPDDKPTPDTGVVRGDVDGNGTVELKDAQIALKIALKIVKNPTPEQIKAADVDNNGSVELKDAQKILKVALKIEGF